MTGITAIRNTHLWRASVLASLLFLLFAAPIHAETDSTRVARLFLWASDGNVRHRDLVEPAKDSLGQMGAKAAPWLAKKLGTSDARERLTLADIFEKIGKPATPFLIPYLDAPGEDTPRNTARCLERIKDTAAVIPLLAHMDHPEYSVRSQVATALGKTKHHMALDSLIWHLSHDPDSDVRKSCAVALGEIASKSATAFLFIAFGDTSFAVRHSAVVAIAKLRDSPGDISDDHVKILRALYRTAEEVDTLSRQWNFLSRLWSCDTTWDAPVLLRCADNVGSLGREEIVVAMGACGGDLSQRRLKQHLRDTDYRIRGFAVEGMTYEAWRYNEDVAELKKRETDPFVLAQIARFEQIVIEKKNAEAKPK